MNPPLPFDTDQLRQQFEALPEERKRELLADIFDRNHLWSAAEHVAGHHGQVNAIPCLGPALRRVLAAEEQAVRDRIGTPE